MPHSRQSSSSSGIFSPGLTPLDSSASLILVHDPEEITTPFDFDDDTDDDESLDVRKLALSPSSVFLYLLSPYLKLSAMLLPYSGLSLKFGLPAFILFAVLSLFSRQIWFLLGRYTHKPDLEDVILDAFARGRNKERTRQFIRSIVRSSTVCFRILLAAIYLRQSVSVLLPLFPETAIGTRLLLTIPLILMVVPLSGGQSFAPKRVQYATSASIAAYVLWFALITFSYIRGTLRVEPQQISSMGLFWKVITTTAFTFTTTSTLTLYTSLKGTSVPGTKTSRSGSFNTLASLSSAVAVSLLLPLVFYSAFPKPPLLPQNAEAPPVQPISLEPFISTLSALTLMLSIPSVLVSTPAIPIPSKIRRTIPFSISKSIIFIAVFGVAISTRSVARVLADILIVGSLLGTYFLPALIHITTHFFKRPLSIVIPSGPAVHPNSVSSPLSDTPLASAGPSAGTHDELLQRKEHALQKRQTRRRIIWDIGVWVLLVPVGGGGCVWAVGVLLGRW